MLPVNLTQCIEELGTESCTSKSIQDYVSCLRIYLIRIRIYLIWIESD
jgi:hypothetical protein